MLVTIVAVPNADNTGIDLERVEKVENLPAEIARRMVDLGTARLPSEEELNAYRDAKVAEVEQQIADAETEPVGARDSGPDLDSEPAAAASSARTAKKTASAGTESQPSPVTDAT